MSGVIYRPGQTVPVSGLYSVVTQSGFPVGRRVTCVLGEPFPPTKNVGEYGYVLYMATNP